MQNSNPDVVVVGGGPAGSSTATFLAKAGWKVTLLEREKFPRDHVGESLLPGSLPVLEQLGVLPEVEAAGFLKKWGATMVWGADKEPWSWRFKETNQQYPHAYQVWRPQFDQILLENSRKHGVSVIEGVHVNRVVFKNDRAVGVRYKDAAGAEGRLDARYVVDASGQSGLIGRSLRLRKPEPDFRNLAIYGYFTSMARLPDPDENNIFIEAFEQGWAWNIPLHNDRTSVGVVMDSQKGQEMLQGAEPERVFLDLLSKTERTAEMLKGATLIASPTITKDWSYHSTNVAGPGYVMVGDAACFIDPLFSSGVHLALHSSVLAAAYVTTALRHRELEVEAGQTYKELYYQQFDHFRELARLFYASNRTVESYFWDARRILNADRVTPREAFVRGVSGQPPQGYERVVIEKGLAPDDFSQRLDELESLKDQRRDDFERLTSTEEGDGEPLIFAAVPKLATGVAVENRLILIDGEFQRGPVLVQTWDPAGQPINAALAAIVGLVDGRRSVGEMLGIVTRGLEPRQAAEFAPSFLAALRALYVDGAVDEIGTGVANSPV